MNNDNTIYALLYTHGGDMQKKDILSVLEIDSQQLEKLVEELTRTVTEQPFEVFQTSTTLSLRTKAQYADVLAVLDASTTKNDISNASLEVLAIVLYKGKVARTDIDYLRGVNTSSTLRQLVLRGLLERTRSQSDSSAWVYIATPELFSYLGVTNSTQLPEYEDIHTKLQII